MRMHKTRFRRWYDSFQPIPLAKRKRERVEFPGRRCEFMRSLYVKYSCAQMDDSAKNSICTLKVYSSCHLLDFWPIAILEAQIMKVTHIRKFPGFAILVKEILPDEVIIRALRRRR